MANSQITISWYHFIVGFTIFILSFEPKMSICIDNFMKRKLSQDNKKKRILCFAISIKDIKEKLRICNSDHFYSKYN